MTDEPLFNDRRTLGNPGRAVCRPALYEDLAQGERELRRAFREAPHRIAAAGSVLVARDRPSEALYVLRRGWACRVREWGDGRRSIPEIHLPGDLIGLEAALRDRPADAVVTVEAVTVQALAVDVLPALLARRSTATYLAWAMGERQRRAERRSDWIARFEAPERLAALLHDLHERLRRRELVMSGSFNLPLTQQQIGDHLGLTVVHVNRMLRLLREEKIAIIDRHVVMIRDMERLRQLANPVAATADPGETSAFPAVAEPLPPPPPRTGMRVGEDHDAEP